MSIRSRIAQMALIPSVALVATATPAAAVIDGQEDGANTYSNVGRLEFRLDEDVWAWCSATLVAEDIVLTAGHCVVFLAPDGVGNGNVRITFDPSPDPDSAYIYATDAKVHPALTFGPPRGNTKLAIGPGVEDVALVWLAEPPPGIEPAPIVAEGRLDALDLTAETFTIVGYGFTDFITGSGVSAKPEFVFGPRTFREVSVVTEHEVFADRYLKITASTCLGDSGGPLLHNDTVVALNVVTLSHRCEAPSYSYRLDTPLAQSFLNEWLG